MAFRRLASSIAFTLLTVCASSAQAQVIGTFRWQTLTYCNVITLTIVQQGGMYQLTGADDLCGAGVAPATGTAVVTGGGVALGLTVVLPSGAAAHITSIVNAATGNGTWTDADGNGGVFLLAAGPASGGSARPAPASAAAITATQLSPTIYAGTGSAITVARSDHNHDARYYTQAQSDAAHNALLTKAALGPRGIIAQAEVIQSSQTFRYSRASNGQTLTVMSPIFGPGTSVVSFPGFAGAPGGSFDQTVQVTSTGYGVVCSVVLRTDVGTTLTAEVRCFNPSTLQPVDSAFFITVTS